MQSGEQEAEGLRSWRRSALLLAVAALATTAACYSPDHTGAHPTPITQELFTPNPVTPLSPTPFEQLTKPPVSEQPTPTDTEPRPLTKEIKPGEKIGKLEVHISGAGALKKVITHDLFADPRTKKEIDDRKPVDPDHDPKVQEVLDEGLLWHRDTHKPVRNKDITKPDGKKYYPTVVAGHRVTQIKGSPYGSLVLMDIDQIKTGKDGDLLVMTLTDGTVARYKATSHQEVHVNDVKTQSKIFLTKSAVEELIVYACDTRDPRGVPKRQRRRYTPDTRYVVTYTRIN